MFPRIVAWAAAFMRKDVCVSLYQKKVGVGRRRNGDSSPFALGVRVRVRAQQVQIMAAIGS